ncbi:class I SAM-dependent DNA methyltransferase [Paenibacillus thailandensis]|uniref:Uncharacterized methyltransferase ACFSW5_14070 n=1 Tax=Paenibacillus thailandensis TaxID=393250 RepID=A0ABW5QZB6_9BACL
MSKDFTELFDEWSERYDETVAGGDEEYREVFDGYDRILEEVASRVSGTVLEFGVGTGNLTEKLLRRGCAVYGIEPSKGMREQALKRQFDMVLAAGDFLRFPLVPEKIDAVASTYAFHHLTDEEKEEAIAIYSGLLGAGGKLVFADTMFEGEEERREIEEAARAAGHVKLLNDLRTEYYTTLNVLEGILVRHGFEVSFYKLNRYVWLMDATKASEEG